LVFRCRQRVCGCSEAEIRLGQLLVVHVDRATLEADRVTAGGNDALDVKAMVLRVFEHDHLSTLRGAKDIGPFSEHILIAIMKRWRHADSANSNCFHDILTAQKGTCRSQDREQTEPRESLKAVDYRGPLTWFCCKRSVRHPLCLPQPCLVVCPGQP